MCLVHKNSRGPPNLSGGKIIFGKNWHITLEIPWEGSNFVEIALSPTVSDINAFLHFTQKLKMTAINGRKMIFGKKWQMTRHIPQR